MSITLSADGVTVELQPDMFWSDELSWASVAQSADRAITGALIVSMVQLQGGRPITLEPMDDASGWIPLSAVEQLQAWAAVAGQQMQLAIRGMTLTVIYRHQDAPGLDPTPIVKVRNPRSADRYRVTLKLMEV